MRSMRCSQCREEISPGQNFCPACGATVDAATRGRAAKRRRGLRPRTIRRMGDLLASAMSGAATAAVVLILTNNFTPREDGPVQVAIISPRPFEEQTARGPVNASALVPMADSTFLVVDDLTDDAFYELHFAPDGTKSRPLERRPISGLAQGLVEDLEGATLVDAGGPTVIAAVSSMEGTEGENTDSGLVRVTVGDGGALSGEVMPGFRTWLLASFDALTAAPGGAVGLDVQGLVWDPNRKALLLGIRFPTGSGGALVLPVRVRDWSGPWETSNLEAMPPITLGVTDKGVARGILGLAYHPVRREHFIIVGNATGKSKAASLYVWNGGDDGKLRPVSKMVFHPDTKPEGMAFGTIGGKPAAVVVDDAGGYYVVWQSELDEYLAM